MVFEAAKRLGRGQDRGKRTTSAAPAFPRSEAVIPSDSRTTGIMAAGAKVDTKDVKNPNQQRWNARMWGRANERMLMDRALCSESTGRANCLSPVAIAGGAIVAGANYRPES